jgi:UDP-2-acetamido-3-amino-2,3-dideoxy-glucuronate N-acetyltransferase
MTFQFHKSAVIDFGAQIGAQTKIWHFSHVCGGARIGNNCSLGQNVFIGNDVVIGNNVKIQNNVSVYDAVTLEDDVFCGPSMVFTNVYNPRSHVARKNEYQKTLVQKGATIGANSTIVCGVTIGYYAFIGAGSVIKSDVVPYAIMVGVPARQIGFICKCGIKLKFVDNQAHCDCCSMRYQLVDDKCCVVLWAAPT